MTHVDVTVINPRDLARSWVGRFLVDTGAFHTLVPRRHLEAIGIRPDRQRTFEMADGTPITLDIAIARLDFLGEYGADVVVFGEGDVEPLLGVTALESAGMVVDPRTQQLRRLPILPLKAIVFPELAGVAA
ncbi:MAG: clan AA aspartic protease [Gammaproteobacteria bacterium]|nr:clan AA aspartic protease [Gammaproteobacteria bacterium]